VDLIVDVRRNAVVMDSEFPKEYQGLYRNLERSGNPWGAPAASRISWVSELDFPVRVLGDDGTDVIPPDIEWLFWVGCAGAYDPKARETTKAVAELLTRADCKFMILGDREKCTGDPARRTGNELLFQELAQENVETLNAAGVKYIVVTCPHCLNSLGREYPQLNGHYEVVHHTDLLSYLYPADTVDAGADSVTFHDPCYLARHNGITEPGRQLIAAAGLSLTEMPRNKERTFCCGAGGGQMWKEENLGTRVRDNRLDEARSVNAEIIATACPFCTVMLDDSGAEKPVEVREVSTLLLHHIRSFEKSSES
jgi:Fe-S oxidoreductase